MTEYQFRPISTWPGELTKSYERRSSPFGSGYTATLDLLERELEHLKAKDVVLELALREADIRQDGRPRSNAKPPDHPGVVVSFDSKHGPLRYATDVFRNWHANLRAIALGLEALRKVERYGITKRGEQYAGWKQLEATASSSTDARGFLCDLVDERTSSEDVDPEMLEDDQLVRIARRVSHPDAAGGSHDLFLKVQAAAERLGVA